MLVPSTQYSNLLDPMIPRASFPLKKIKVLAWLDSPIVFTGFGTVARHILKSIHDTGRYEIQQLGINHHGDFLDTNKIPWQVQPAKLLNPNDPHGMQMFLQLVAKHDYDILFVCNDVYVTQEVAKQYAQIIQDKIAKKHKLPKLIYYYPVDCHVLSTANSFIKLADMPVCYTNHGRAETLKTTPEVTNKLLQMPHGIDTDTFKPLPQNIREQIRKQMLNAEPDTFVVLNFNRNSTRKQIQYSMLAFREFHKIVPKSRMYIHSAVLDQGGDLMLAVQELGLNPREDIAFPINYSAANGVPDETLNAFYNMGDLFLTTHLGEGWGLSITEAMGAGIPVLVPDNTCMRQLCGEDEERGYIYPCNDQIWIDNSGYRLKGNIPDIVSKMMECYNHRGEKVQAARDWTTTLKWKDIGKKWVELFDKVLVTKQQEHQATPAKIVSETL